MRSARPIDGHDVMAYLGIGPGPMVGSILKVLLDKRIDDGPVRPPGGVCRRTRVCPRRGHGRSRSVLGGSGLVVVGSGPLRSGIGGRHSSRGADHSRPRESGAAA